MTFITRDANLSFDIDLEICSRVPRIFWLVDNFLAGQECFFLFRDNLIGECRGSPVSEITVTITTAIIIF